jgi:hypothetical protein
MYHVSQEVFDKLVDLLGDMIMVNDVKFRPSTYYNDTISVEHWSRTEMSWWRSIRDIFGISSSSTRRIASLFIASVLEWKALTFIATFELKQKQDQFHDISFYPGKMLYGF